MCTNQDGVIPRNECVYQCAKYCITFIVLGADDIVAAKEANVVFATKV